VAFQLATPEVSPSLGEDQIGHSEECSATIAYVKKSGKKHESDRFEVPAITKAKGNLKYLYNMMEEETRF